MSNRIYFLLIPFAIVVGSLEAQQTISFNYWNDDTWSATVDVEYWIEINGKRSPLGSFENGIEPTSVDEEILLIAKYDNLQLGFKKGKKRGKDHYKYFFLEFSPTESFQNIGETPLFPNFQRTIRLQENSEHISLPFKISPNITEELNLNLQSGFIVRHKEYPDDGWPIKVLKSFTLLPNKSLLDQKIKSQEAKKLFGDLTAGKKNLSDQVKMVMCEKLLGAYEPFLANSELQEIKSIEKAISDKLPELTEFEIYQLILENKKNGLTDEAVNLAKTYLLHLSSRHYKGHYREDVVFTIINHSTRADEVSEFLKVYERDYPSGKFLDELAKIRKKVKNRNGRFDQNPYDYVDISSISNNAKNGAQQKMDELENKIADTTTAELIYDHDKQAIIVLVHGSSNAIMLRIVDRMTQKGRNKILPPNKENYTVNIWTDQEFAQLQSGLYSAQLSKMLKDTSYTISNQIMIGLDRPVHVPKGFYYLSALFVMIGGYGFYQKYLKL